jgi:hypothetical protein
LKSQLDSKESSKAESLVKINNLRKEAHAMLRLQPLEKEKRQTSENKVIKYDQVNQSMNDANEKISGIFDINGREEITRLRQDLLTAKEENEYLLKSITERGKHAEIVESLEREKNQLEKLLEQEIFSKNEYMKRFEHSCTELIEAKAQAKEDIEHLRNTLQNERDNYNKMSGQMKSSNQVLEAEVKVQRDYVNELRSTSWADLAVRLKSEVELAVNQELAKSSMCISQAVGSCEERWKRQIQEVQLQHQNEMVKLKEQFDNDRRFNASRNQILLEESKHEIEEKLKQDHAQALDHIRRQEGSRRLSEIKNEAKKWEQVCHLLFMIYTK